MANDFEKARQKQRENVETKISQIEDTLANVSNDPAAVEMLNGQLASLRDQLKNLGG